MLKQAKGIETYFSQFDVNKDGKIERDEFNLLFDRINRIVDKKKEIDIAAQNDFSDDQLAGGDQNFITDAFDKVKNNFSNTGKTDDNKLSQLVKAMEREGMSTKLFHSICWDFQQTSDRMANNQFLLLVHNAYPKLTVDNINLLISKIQLDPKQISFGLMQQLFNKHSSNSSVEAGKLLTFIANFMINLEKGLKSQADPSTLLKDAFVRFFLQLNLSDVEELTLDQYVSLNKAIIKLRPAYSELIFNSVFHQSPRKTVSKTEIYERTELAVTNLSSLKAPPKISAPLD